MPVYSLFLFYFYCTDKYQPKSVVSGINIYCLLVYLRFYLLFFLTFLFAELPDRSIAASATLLPLSAKDKDGRNKEENYKLLNGNSGDPADRVWQIYLPFPLILLYYTCQRSQHNMIFFSNLLRDKDLK